MNKEQAQQIIRDTFENTFEINRFTGFVRNLLNHIEDASLRYHGNYIPEAYRPYIKSLERIGKFSDGENSLDVLIITLHKETSLERARTMQRNFIAWYLNGSRPGGGQKDAALVAYVSPDQADWRFSLVKMDYKFEKTKTGKIKVKEDFTPARRWSFLVGVNEKSHTAQSRLVKILSDDEHAPTLAELEEAFNIETVTKEFFLKYRELFIRTKEALDNVVNSNHRVKADFQTKGVDTVNFAKKLLGQIVFLYFLQKKNWFGVCRDDNWGEGSKHFLRELFAGKHGNYANFFNDIMEPLFYEALRIDRSHDDDYYSRFNCKIPFLNGGLFDPIGNYDWVHTDIILPNDLFSNTRKTKEGDIGDGILDVFDRYNFTVREDEPLEKEVAIDPELLGKAYEKFNAIRPDNFDEFTKALMSGKKGDENKFNKKFGVYYTPREIVHYMCKQSLINYLHTCAEENKTDIPITKNDIEDLIEVGELITEHEATALIKEENIKNGIQKSSEYTSLLSDGIRKNARIIDEWLSNVTVCDPAVGSGAFPVGMMTEVVRVRNVLTVFLKEDKRSDYEFKHRCIEHSLYGVDIDSGAVEIAKLRLWLSLVVDEEDIKNIKPLPNLDYKIVCGDSLLGVERNLFNYQLFNNLEKLKHLFFNETNPTKKKDYKKQINELISQITNGRTEFDFEVYFSEVFHQKGGFDVIIANPPYLGEKGNKDIFRPIAKGKLAKYYQGKMDLFYFFLHLALDLGKINSINSFITTNYFITAKGARKLRTDLKDRSIIRNIINFNELKIFESALGQHNMITIFSTGYNGVTKAKTCITKRTGTANEEILNSIVSSKDKGTDFFYIKQKSLYDGEENYIRLSGAGNVDIPIEKVLEKIKEQGVNLGGVNGVCNINTGLFTAADAIYIKTLDEIKTALPALNNLEKSLLKPLFKNSDINKYSCNNIASKRVIYHHEKAYYNYIKDIPNIFSYLLLHQKKLKNRKDNSLKGALKRGRWDVIALPKTAIDFEGPKIVAPHRSKTNSFGYNEIPWYASADVYFITLKGNSNLEYKYILALMNSKLYYKWLYYRGKRKGETLELYQKPLTEVPIKIIPKEDQKLFIGLVDQILTIKNDINYLKDPLKQESAKELVHEIDRLVYQLYNLTEEEIRTVEDDGK